MSEQSEDSNNVIDGEGLVLLIRETNKRAPPPLMTDELLLEDLRMLCELGSIERTKEANRGELSPDYQAYRPLLMDRLRRVYEELDKRGLATDALRENVENLLKVI